LHFYFLSASWPANNECARAGRRGIVGLCDTCFWWAGCIAISSAAPNPRTHAPMPTRTCAHTRTNAHTDRHAHTHPYTHAPAHQCTPHKHTYTYTYARTCAHAHTPALVHKMESNWGDPIRSIRGRLVWQLRRTRAPPQHPTPKFPIQTSKIVVTLITRPTAFEL